MSVHHSCTDLNALRDSEKHSDVEWHIDCPNGETRIFKTLREAAGAALFLALSGRTIEIDCVCWSQEGAAFLGEDLAERYAEDPECSVLARIVVKAEDTGRVA